MRTKKKEAAPTCLIVGASGGLGRVLSHCMASKGQHLLIHGRDREKLERLAKQLTTAASLRIIEQNFRTRADIYEFIEKLTPHRNFIDIAIVSFGPIVHNSMKDTFSDQYEYMFDMNLLLPSLLIKELAPAMAEKKWGRIVVLGGTGTDQNRAYRKIAVYSAAKYGLNSIVRSAALEFGKYGVTTNLISPGYIETEYYDTPTIDNLKKRGLVLDPQRISDIIDFLISNSAAAVNGSIIGAGNGT